MGGPSSELCGLVGRIDFPETVECVAPSSEPAAGRDSPCPSRFLTLFSGAHLIRPGPPRAPCLSESSQGPHESELPPLLPHPALTSSRGPKLTAAHAPAPCCCPGHVSTCASAAWAPGPTWPCPSSLDCLLGSKGLSASALCLAPGNWLIPTVVGRVLVAGAGPGGGAAPLAPPGHLSAPQPLLKPQAPPAPQMRGPVTFVRESSAQVPGHPRGPPFRPRPAPS